jgi:hypothetical protein
MVWRHNDWSQSNPFLLNMRRQEEHCLATADALLCPSDYLKRGLADHYGLDRSSITTIPYPIGELHGSPLTVSEGQDDGPVLYVGRIEARKGLFEFVDAAVAVARQTPDVHFEFIGSDVHGPDGASTRVALERRIPHAMQRRFTFAGALPRRELWARYAAARFAVIPSRWENFPNTCIEAMAVGVPVLASPEGGMSEIIEDGVSGWIADSQSPSGLEAALRRALFASPQVRVAMGRAAQKAIENACGNAVITERQRAFRREIISRGADRSRRLPRNLPTANAPMHEASSASVGQLAPAPSTRADLTLFDDDAGPHLAHAHDGHAAEYAIRLASRYPHGSVAIVAPGYAADLKMLKRASRLLADNADVGVVTGWARRGYNKPSVVPLCPAFPYQWLANEAWPVAVLRSSAILSAAAIPRGLAEPHATWYLVNAILVGEWKAVSAPFIIASAVADQSPGHWEVGTERASEMRSVVRAAFPQALARDALALVSLLESTMIVPSTPQAWIAGPDRWTGLSFRGAMRLPLRDKIALVGECLKNPWRIGAWLRTTRSSRGDSGVGNRDGP